MFQKLILKFQLLRYLRLRRRVEAVEEQLALKDRLPEHGSYDFGGVRVLRFDASNGYDIQALTKARPVTKYPDFYTPTVDLSKVPEQLKNRYAKPRVEKVKVSLDR